jgi:hypothetical protein
MKNFSKNIFWMLWFMVLLELPCDAHDENVHRFITRSAFASSSGLNAFLADNLGDNLTFIAAHPHGYNATDTHWPETWLEWGAYYEDMEDPIIGGFFDSPRAQDHFYTLTFQPPRIPGQVIGLTDSSESPLHQLLANGTNSFAWGAIKGTPLLSYLGVVLVKTNDQTWQNARDYEFAALTNSLKGSREENLALMLDSLGHVLHLNQDLTSPDHVRNDNHYNDAHRFIENYGQQNYLKNPQWFNQQPHGWSYWQSQGFSKLLDFWDRGHYTGNASALNADAGGSDKLGLAEWSNGNFLGEDALYNEVVGSDLIHSFPYPSLNSSTTFPSLRANMTYGVGSVLLANGQIVNRIYVNKNADGISVTPHSVVSYLGAVYPRKGGPLARVSVSINDSNVLQEYHNILLPKAVEYSAGILDYFFRGTMSVSLNLETNNPYTFTNLNTSGQDFYGGSFSLIEEDSSENRTIVQQTNLSDMVSGGILPNGNSVNITYPGPAPSGTKFLVVYQGTIGQTNGTDALDPVDSNIGIAAARPLVEQTITYTYQPSVGDVGIMIATNLESDDFPFTPTAGNFEVIVNQAYMDDNGSIGGVDAPVATDCRWPHTPLINAIVPAANVTIVGNHLQVNVTATDNGCGAEVGWVDVSITWRVFSPPQ